MYRNFCNKRSGSWNIKRLLLIKENQISQVKELSTFLYMRKCKSLGSLKSFLWHALQASRASILCFLILSLFTPSRVGECCRWWIFFVFILSFLWLHTWVQLVVMWRLHGCTVLCLLIWQPAFLVHRDVLFVREGKREQFCPKFKLLKRHMTKSKSL